MNALAGKSVLYVTDRDLSDGSKGNVQRIRNLLSALASAGTSVRVIAPDSGRSPLDNLPGPCIRVPGPSFKGGDPRKLDISVYRHAVSTITPVPDIAISGYAWLAPSLEVLPTSVIRLVDTHDVLHLRTAAFREAGLDPWVECSAEDERALVAQAHGLIAISPRDAVELERLIGGTGPRTCCIPHLIDLPEAARPSSGAKMLFVGSNHAGNLGILDFIRLSLPPIRAACPSAELIVAGTIALHMPPAEGVTLLGPVEKIGICYEQAALVVAPITVGSGLKIKSVEALAHSRALVALPEALAGLPEPSVPIWQVCGTLEELATAAIRLLQNFRQRHAMEDAARSYVRDHLSYSRVSQMLALYFDTRSSTK